ncbi:hypothetical protein BDV97DRAFT_370579 [Delphinella strobiligena]|nr:hypothetical protein BDV97DRAFT_370579 [Delphinella strobiligena]
MTIPDIDMTEYPLMPSGNYQISGLQLDKLLRQIITLEESLSSIKTSVHTIVANQISNPQEQGFPPHIGQIVPLAQNDLVMGNALRTPLRVDSSETYNIASTTAACPTTIWSQTLPPQPGWQQQLLQPLSQPLSQQSVVQTAEAYSGASRSHDLSGKERLLRRLDDYTQSGKSASAAMDEGDLSKL